MGGIFNTYNYPSGTYKTKADQFCYDLAIQLFNSGWSMQPRPPIFKIVMTVDISAFGGVSQTGFFAVSPPSGVIANPIVIVDSKHGYPVDVVNYTWVEVGSTAKEDVFPYIVQAIITLGMATGTISDTGFQDPSETNPHAYLQWGQPTVPLEQTATTANIGVALHTSKTPLTQGGYECWTGNCNVFIGRRPGVDGLNNPGPIGMMFSYGGVGFIDPVFEQYDDETVRTQWTDLTVIINSNLTLSFLTNSKAFYLWVVSDSRITAVGADLECPADGEVQEACFGAVTISNGFLNWRNGARQGGAAFFTAVDGTATHANSASGNHIPTLMGMWQGQSTGGTLWEGGYAQISEAWVGFSEIAGQPAQVLGKMPEAIIVNRDLNTALFGSFEFDDYVYRPVTQDVTTASNFSLCFRSDDEADNTCPGIA